MISTMRTLTLAALAALTLACNGTTAPTTAEFPELPADQVLTGTTNFMTTDGVRTARLRSDSTLIWNDSSMVGLRGVVLELYQEGTGVVRATLTSRSGELDRNTNRMIARGDVVLEVAAPNRRTVTTEELHYDPQQHQIWSDVRTCSVTPGQGQQCGAAFRSDDQFRNPFIDRPSGNVRITF